MRALNEPTDTPVKHHKVVHGRMKDSFTSMYQTILSIIQGVALADLATVVVAKYPQFTIVHWLMVLTTFFLLIVVFNVYSIQSAVWDWIPDIRDESIPFVFGALELFLNHTISLSMSLWFLGLAGISTLGALGTVHMVWRAHEENENEELLGLAQGSSSFVLPVLCWRSGSCAPVCLHLLCSTNSSKRRSTRDAGNADVGPRPLYSHRS